MAGVFSQIYIHIVFSVKNREALILPEWEENLYKYTTGIIEKRGHKMLAIGGMPDHIHIFFGLKPAEAISDLVREIKKATNEYVKDQRLSTNKFDWQTGYGAFSYRITNKRATSGEVGLLTPFPTRIQNVLNFPACSGFYQLERVGSAVR